MHGNVWEWCEDDWQKNYVNAPMNGSALISLSDGKVLRGSLWFGDPRYCRSAERYYDFRDNRVYSFGFRVVCLGAAWT